MLVDGKPDALAKVEDSCISNSKNKKNM